MNYFIPLVSGLLYRLGGADQIPLVPLNMKLFRWFMGAIIGSMAFINWNIYLLTVLLYFIATNAFVYGEKSWLNFLGEKWKFFVCGLVFGLASIPILGLSLGLIQGVLSGLAFLGIKILDDADKLHNPWVELLRGFFGTIVFIIK